MRSLLFFTVLFGSSLTGCASTTREASVASWTVERFEVRAEDAEVGAIVANSLPAAGRAVRLVPGLRDAGIGRIDVAPLGGSQLLGYTRFFPRETAREPEIVIASDTPEPYRSAERVLATLTHELAHYLLAPEWRTLPAVLEEGLCKWAGRRAAPSTSAADRFSTAIQVGRLVGGESAVAIERGQDPNSLILTVRRSFSAADGRLSELPEMLRLRHGELLRSRWSEDPADLYALGDVLVQRIGVARLHELCLEAREEGLELVPASRVLDAAGLPLDRPDLWRAQVIAMTGAKERASFAMWVSGEEGPPHFQLRD